MAYWLAWKNLAQSETLCTWGSSLRGTWEVSPVPGTCAGPAREGNSHTPSMYAGEKSDEVVVPRKHRTKEGNFRRRSWREGPHPRGTADRRPWFETLSRAATSIRLALCAGAHAVPNRTCRRRSTRGRDPMQVRRAG